MQGFTYQADTYCVACAPTELVRMLNGNGTVDAVTLGSYALAAIDIQSPNVSEHSRAFLAECFMERISEILEIDYADAYSYDSGDFPKPFDSLQGSESEDYCASCRRQITTDGTGEHADAVSARSSAVIETIDALTDEIGNVIDGETFYASVYETVPTWEYVESRILPILTHYHDAAQTGDDSEYQSTPTNYVGIPLTLA